MTDDARRSARRKEFAALVGTYAVLAILAALAWWLR